MQLWQLGCSLERLRETGGQVLGWPPLSQPPAAPQHCLAHPPLPLPHLLAAGNALVYECIRTLTTIQPTPVLLTGAVESVSRFLAARENNLKYAGIDALTRLVRIDPTHAQVGRGGAGRCGLGRRRCCAVLCVGVADVLTVSVV